MKGRTQLIAAILAAVCTFAPGVAVFADQPESSAGFWGELVAWISGLIEGDELSPEALGAQPPAHIQNEPEGSILIPPGG